jgi:hypothetical protein
MTSNPAPFLRNQLIAIRCDNGMFWTVVNMGGLSGQPTCFSTSRSGSTDTWEKFRMEVVDAATLKFAIKTTAGFYITAEGSGGRGGPNDAASPVHTDATVINAWEKLLIEYQPDGTFAIKTLSGFYLTCADNGNKHYDSQPFSSNRTQRAAWEIFSAVPLQMFRSLRLAFRTNRNSFLNAVNNGGLSNDNVALSTGARTVGNFEKFYVEVIDLGQNQFALRTLSGYFITFVNGGGMGGPDDASCPIHTDAPNLSTWEQFLAEPQVDGTYAFKTANGGFYLTAVNGGNKQPSGTQPITTTATTRGANEVFTAVYY